MSYQSNPFNSLALQRKIYIIVVDDDEDDRQFIARAFQNIGTKHPVLTFEDGEEFLDHLLQDDQSVSDKVAWCGLIVLDINMHRVSGVEVLEKIKNHPGLKHIPTVMLSTSIEEDLVQEAYSKGANGYLQKPSLMDDYNHLAISMQTCFLNVPCVRWMGVQQ